MTGYADLFAVARKQIVECLTGVRDAVFGIKLDFAHGPIPNTSQMIEPVSELPFLSGIETELELP